MKIELDGKEIKIVLECLIAKRDRMEIHTNERWAVDCVHRKIMDQYESFAKAYVSMFIKDKENNSAQRQLS